MQVSLMPSSSMPVVTEVDASSPPSSSGSAGSFGQLIAAHLKANDTTGGDQSLVGQKARATGPSHQDSAIETTPSLAKSRVTKRFSEAAKPSSSKPADKRFRFASSEAIESFRASPVPPAATSNAPPSAGIKVSTGDDDSKGSSAPQSALIDNALTLCHAVQPNAAVAMPLAQQIDPIATVTVAKTKQPAILLQPNTAQKDFSSAHVAYPPSLSDGSGLENLQDQVTAVKGEGTPDESDSHIGKSGGSFEPSAEISGLRSEIESVNLPSASFHSASALQSSAEPVSPVAEPHSSATDPQGNDSAPGKMSLSTTQISGVAARTMVQPAEISKSHDSVRAILNSTLPEPIRLQKPEVFTSPFGVESRAVQVAFNPSMPGAEFSAHREAVGASNNPFTQLDTAPDLAGLQSHSTRHEVSVGYRDESYGWMEIRTQADGGRMSAVLQTSSTEAHRALSAEAPAIGQYLSDRDIALQTLSVHQGVLESGAHSNAGAQSGHSSQPQAQSQSTSSASRSSGGTPLASADSSEELVGRSLISVHA